MTAATKAKITLRPSLQRGHADHGWLNTYHTFSFASYHDPSFERFGSLRVLNEDRVAPVNGFPTHPHRDAEIFSYILSGTLTHRDSMVSSGAEARSGGDDFYRMRRGDVQFTTGGRGIAHSEKNEDASQWVHFLQIWALPWSRGLTPRYHTRSFSEDEKRKGFVTIISPLKAGPGASEAEETEAKPAVDGTIPIHADLCMAAAILGHGQTFRWRVGGGDGVVRKEKSRRVYVHLPMCKQGKAKVRLDGDETKTLSEGDGAFVEGTNAEYLLQVKNLGEAEAEVIILDSD